MVTGVMETCGVVVTVIMASSVEAMTAAVAVVSTGSQYGLSMDDMLNPHGPSVRNSRTLLS